MEVQPKYFFFRENQCYVSLSLRLLYPTAATKCDQLVIILYDQRVQDTGRDRSYGPSGLLFFLYK